MLYFVRLFKKKHEKGNCARSCPVLLQFHSCSPPPPLSTPMKAIWMQCGWQLWGSSRLGQVWDPSPFLTLLFISYLRPPPCLSVQYSLKILKKQTTNKQYKSGMVARNLEWGKSRMVSKNPKLWTRKNLNPPKKAVANTQKHLFEDNENIINSV